jgi:8-oxo-dGTP diphosphatase
MSVARPTPPEPASAWVQVVAGVIDRGAKVLIGQRVPGAHYEYKWEFPGGKVDPGESPRQALARELWEELAIRAEIGAEIARYLYQYPGRDPIELIFFEVACFEGEPVNRAFHQIRWAPASALPGYDFLEGDIEFVQRLARGGEASP